MVTLISRVGPLLRNPVVQATITNLTSVGLGTVSGVLVARGLGPDGRGHWAAVMAFFTVALVLGEIGQSGAVTFLVSREPGGRRRIVRNARLLMTGGGLVVAIAGFLATPVLSSGDTALETAYRLAFVGCLVNSVCAANLFALQARSIRLWNVARVAQPLFYASGILVLLITATMDIVTVAVVLIVSTSLQFVVLAFLTRSSRQEPESAPPEAGTLRPLARYGLAYSAAAVPTSLAGQYDKIALSRLVSPADLGLYAVGTTVSQLVAPFATAISSVVFPRASKSDLKNEERRNVEIRTLSTTLVVSVVVSLGIAVLAPVLVPLLFGADFRDAVPVVWALAAVMVARAMSQVAGALVRARNAPGAAAAAQVAGLVVGLVLIFPVVAVLGMLGAAVALGTGEAVTLVVVTVALARLQSIDRRSRRDVASSDPRESRFS
jgi:O-antigen/teichoic acid export membrane protein